MFSRKQQLLTKGGFTYLVCVDGSKKSLRCLHTTTKLARHTGDKIIACFAPSPDRLNQTEKIEKLV